VLLAPGTSAASVGTRFIQKLRQISILGGVYPVVAALGLVALIVGLIGLVAVHATNKEVRELEEVANNAFFAQRASALIYAVVADSRGVYMSSEAADRATYGAGILKFLTELEANMAEWKEHVAPDDREGFARAQARADEFIRFRTELVRLGNEVGQAEARAWGDNEANRTNREALNRPAAQSHRQLRLERGERIRLVGRNLSHLRDGSRDRPEHRGGHPANPSGGRRAGSPLHRERAPRWAGLRSRAPIADV